MKILVAEDDPVSRRLLEVTLGRWGYEVVSCVDGDGAMRALATPEPPRMAVLDWMMPEVDGVEVCRRVRTTPGGRRLYLVLLTAKGRVEDLVEGLGAGADDYLVKPFQAAELQARLQVGRRILDLQDALAARVGELEAALSQVHQLQGLIPICSYCHKVRDDRNYWQRVEQYVADRSGARFSHSVCPACFEAHVRPELEALEDPGAAPDPDGRQP